MKRLVLLSLALFLLLPGAAPRAKVVEEIVIKVNDAIVTRSEYEQRLKSTMEGLKREYKGPDLQEQLKQVPQKLLEQMEDELLLVEKAKQLYNVDAIVDNQIDEFMKENHIATKADLAKALQSEGLTMEEFRKQLTLIYVPEFMRSREIRSKISISTDEIRDYYEAHKSQLASKPQVQLEEILILKQGHTLEQAQAMAAQIRKEFMAGKSFGDLAEEYSQAFSRTRKGEAGWFTADDLASPIAKAVFALKVGEVTDLIPTDAGWYLFRLENRKDATVPTLDQSRDQIIEALKEEKFQKEYKKYIENLKAQNYVRINPKYV
ncbi:MAG: peptidyl-prolyl cis-trans isomerase [Acidobacteriota bacterium]